MTPGKKTNDTLWTRKGLYYQAVINIYGRRGYVATCTKRLFWPTYHLIRLIHGVEKLRKMATEVKFL